MGKVESAFVLSIDVLMTLFGLVLMAAFVGILLGSIIPERPAIVQPLHPVYRRDISEFKGDQ